MKSIVSYFKEVFKDRRVLWDLIKNDFKAKYTNSLLGIVWAFLVPLVTILVLWFVFEKGFRSGPMNGVPFILWYIPAFLVWNLFTEAFGAASSCLLDYYYLVKNLKFRVSILPAIRIVSSSFVHFFFIGFIFIIYAAYGYMPRINNIQIIYYLACLYVYLIGLTLFTSALAVFSKDVLNLINLVVQVGFWATPIVWSTDGMPAIVQSVVKLNPMFYICNGYREAFCTDMWFWDRPMLMTYFWCFTLIQLIIGIYTFRRLKPQFADML